MLPHPLTIQHSTHIDPHMLMCTMSNVHAHYVKCESINQTGIPACTHINPCNIQLRCGYECAYDWILQPICPGSHIHVPVNGQSLYLVPIYIQPGTHIYTALQPAIPLPMQPAIALPRQPATPPYSFRNTRFSLFTLQFVFSISNQYCVLQQHLDPVHKHALHACSVQS